MKELTMNEVECVGGGVNWSQLCKASTGLATTTGVAVRIWPNPVTAVAAITSAVIAAGSCSVNG
jgi:hypothetical protein